MNSLSINTVFPEDFEQATEMSQSPEVAPLENCETIEVISSEAISSEGILSTEQLNPKTSKNVIRRSLRASTIDGVFATVFSNTTGGVLLSNFILDLGASSTQIGLLASIPMLANLLQPIGAYFSEKTTSRHVYCLWIYGISRLMWVALAIGIFLTNWYHFDAQSLIYWTLGISLATHLLGALGSASWLSWMAVLVPRRLRGRYFGFRNSAANLTNLISIPLLGLIISLWFRGALEGFGIVLLLGIVFGIVSLAFQFFIVDVNPQMQHLMTEDEATGKDKAGEDRAKDSEADGEKQPNISLRQSFTDILKDTNFLMFLLYFNLWMFSVNLCAPFFNLYLLDNLKLDISQVTLYNSITAAANLLMLLVWGKIADRIGNRPILIGVGVLVAVTPILWLFTGADELSIWLWLPLLHILGGGTWAAIDLCTNNLQIGVAPVQNQTAYFGIVAAVAGVSGALGTLAGGYMAQIDGLGGLFGIFVLSGILRLFALLPLVFVHEQRSQPLHQVMQLLFPAAEESSV